VRALAEDLRGKGVTVNAVCPGYLDTEMTDRTLARIVERTGRPREQALAEVLAAAGQAALVPPERVAQAVLELLDDPTRTGAALEVSDPA